MSIVTKAGETLARGTMDRRRFMSRAAVTVFGVVAAWSVEGIKAPSAMAGASDACAHSSSSCQCSVCGTGYCTAVSASYCSGAACAGGCTYYGGCGWPTGPGYGCWCTQTCYYGSGQTEYGGYYKCCDCACPNNRKCSCRQFVRTCGNGTGQYC